MSNKRLIYAFISIAILLCIAAVIFAARGNALVTVILGMLTCVVCVLVAVLQTSANKARVLQSDKALSAARQTLTFLQDGLTSESAKKACQVIMPMTAADGVAVCSVDGTLGVEKTDDAPAFNPNKVFNYPEAVELFPQVNDPAPVVVDYISINKYKNAVTVLAPIIVRNEVIAIIALFYRNRHLVTKAELNTIDGFAELISTRLSLAELDTQTKLAARMELRALQAQINPHFLFNTINTIASLIRTDPVKARMLLREFAVFYRRTLENSMDLITLDQELEQTMRYLLFEHARFGNDRIVVDVDIEPHYRNLQVPAFILQPIVENAVQHAMRESEPLNIRIFLEDVDGRIAIKVADDGVGMSKDRIPVALRTESSGKGTGIALKNVDDRLTGFFGAEAGLEIDSVLDEGTTVTLKLGDATVV